MPYPVAASRGGKSGLTPFLPSDVAGLQIWLKADAGVYQDDAGTTPAVADADPVGLWQDQSGNGVHVSQATAGARPLLRLGANGMYGSPALYFDGTDDELVRVISNWLAANQAGTIIAAHQVDAAVATGYAQYIFRSWNNAGSAMYLEARAYTTTATPKMSIWQRYNDTPSSVVGTTEVRAYGRYVDAWLSDGSAWSLRRNGVDQSLTGTNTGEWLADVAGRDRLSVGKTLKGLLAEMLLYDTFLAPAALASVEEYLSAKYNILTSVVTFAILGDSIAAEANGFPLLVNQQYRNPARSPYYNHAVGGHTIMANMDAQTVAAASDAADLIIVALGTNDADGGDMVALQAEYEENIAELKVSNPAATIYAMNVLPRFDGNSKTNIRAAIAAAAAAQAITCWDTYTDPWIEAGDTSDGVHPTAGGHAKIATEILALLP